MNFLNILFLLFVFVTPINIVAQIVTSVGQDKTQEWQCAGGFRFGHSTSLAVQPTAQQGLLDFNHLNAQARNRCQVDSQSFVTAEVEWGSLRNQNTYPTLLFNEFNISFGDNLRVKTGLMWDPFILVTHYSYQGHYYYNKSGSLFQRQNLLPTSELGVESTFDWGGSTLGLRFSHGDPWPGLEKGTHKDVTLWWGQRFDSKKSWDYLFYLRGGSVHSVNESSNLKQRGGFFVQYNPKSSGFKFGVQFLHHETGVDGVLKTNSENPYYQFGEGIDLLGLGGEVIRGGTAEIWFSYKFLLSEKEWIIKMGDSHLNIDNPQHKMKSLDVLYRAPINKNIKVYGFASQSYYEPGYGILSVNRESLGAGFEFMGSWIH